MVVPRDWSTKHSLYSVNIHSDALQIVPTFEKLRGVEGVACPVHVTR